MRKQRLHKLQQCLAEWEKPAFIITSKENIFYLSGFSGSAGKLLVTLDQVFLYSDFRYREQAARELPDYVTFVECKQYQKELTSLQEKNIYKTWLFEAKHCSYHEGKKIEGLFNEAVTVVPQEKLVETLRLTKDEQELATIQKAVIIAEEAFKATLALIRPGISEREIACTLEGEMKKRGAKSPSFDTIVASGANGALPHASVSDKLLAAGEMVVIDWGASYQGYCSDMTRTIRLGAVPVEQEAIFQIVLAAQVQGKAAVAAGVAARTPDQQARQLIDDRGYGAYFQHSTGHGVGLEVHEEPTLSQNCQDTLLETGMVCTIEPGIYLPEKGGVRIEDMVVVTASGNQPLTSLPRELVIDSVEK